MAREKKTYGDLYLLQLNLLKFRNDYFAICAILPNIKKEVAKYEKLNVIGLKFLASKEKELLHEHCVTDEDGNILWEEGGNGGYRGQQNKTPVFKDAENARLFNDGWAELMNREIFITT